MLQSLDFRLPTQCRHASDQMSVWKRTLAASPEWAVCAVARSVACWVWEVFSSSLSWIVGIVGSSVVWSRVCTGFVSANASSSEAMACGSSAVDTVTVICSARSALRGRSSGCRLALPVAGEDTESRSAAWFPMLPRFAQG